MEGVIQPMYKVRLFVIVAMNQSCTMNISKLKKKKTACQSVSANYYLRYIRF
jgi:hypothetical protein